MTFLRRLFGLGADLQHPLLGRISRDRKSGWRAERVEAICGRGSPSLWLTGDDTAPSHDSVSTYQRLREHWEGTKADLAEDILELNKNYFSDEPTRALQSPNEVWASAEHLAIAIDGDGDIALSFRFDWQDPRDGHEITIHFEKWKPAGISIDG
jgi:hypothetical protein